MRRRRNAKPVRDVSSIRFIASPSLTRVECRSLSKALEDVQSSLDQRTPFPSRWKRNRVDEKNEVERDEQTDLKDLLSRSDPEVAEFLRQFSNNAKVAVVLSKDKDGQLCDTLLETSIAIIGIDALQEILKRRSYGLLQEALSSSLKKLPVFCLTLERVVATTTGFGPADKQDIKWQVCAMGGTFEVALLACSTHLIANQTEGIKYEKVVEIQRKAIAANEALPVHIVSVHWLRECWEKGYRVEERTCPVIRPDPPQQLHDDENEDDFQGHGAELRASICNSNGSGGLKSSYQSVLDNSQGDTISSCPPTVVLKRVEPDNRQCFPSSPLLEEDECEKDHVHDAAHSGERDKADTVAVFRGLKFCFEPETEVLEGIEDVEELILYGEGKVVSQPDKANFIVAAHGHKVKEEVNGGQLLVSPSWIERCIEEKALLRLDSFVAFRPLVVEPPYKSLQGKRISSVNLENLDKENIRHLAEIMGCIFTSTFKRNYFVLLCPENRRYGDKYIAAKTWSIPIVSPQWLEECGRLGKCESFYIYDVSRQPLEDRVIFFGKSITSNRIYQEAAVTLGAKVEEAYSTAVTHYIHDGPIKYPSESLKRALKNKTCRVVSPHWLLECQRRGRLVSELDFPSSYTGNCGLEVEIVQSKCGITRESMNLRAKAENVVSSVNKKDDEENPHKERSKKRKLMFKSRRSEAAFDQFNEVMSEITAQEGPSKRARLNSQSGWPSQPQMEDDEDEVNDRFSQGLPASIASLPQSAFPHQDSKDGSSLSSSRKRRKKEAKKKEKAEEGSFDNHDDCDDRMDVDGSSASFVTDRIPLIGERDDQNEARAKRHSPPATSREVEGVCSELQELMKNASLMKDASTVEVTKRGSRKRCIGSRADYSASRQRRSDVERDLLHDADEEKESFSQTSQTTINGIVCEVDDAEDYDVAIDRSEEISYGRQLLKRVQRQGESPSPSQRRSEGHKPIVLLSQINPKQKQQIAAWAKKLRFEVVELPEAERATHVVIGGLQQGAKLMAGIARGAWIVKPRWMEACQKEGKVVSEREYAWRVNESDPTSSAEATERELISAADRWRKHLHRKRALQDDCPGAFEGWKVLVMLSKKKMQYCEILKAGGATLTPLKLPFKGKGNYNCAIVDEVPQDKISALRDVERRGINCLKPRFFTDYLMEENLEMDGYSILSSCSR